jgi:hypothetical protein
MPLASSASATGVHFNSTPARSLKALLSASIDYAGLFPSCELPLEPALQNQAQYVRSAESWMLNSFVLPVGKFGAASASFPQFEQRFPLRISALGPKKEAAAEFEQAVAAVADGIRGIQSGGNAVAVVQLEIAIPSDCNLSLIARLNALADEFGLRIFCEAPPADAGRTIALLAQNNTTRKSPLGFKLRTGGVTADAFPQSKQIACALVAATRDQVPIKFTAGLHHPVRQFRDEVKTKMHGFLNVLGAGILAAEHAWDENTTTTMLEDEDTGSFRFEGDTFAWREWKIATQRIEAHRQLITSFGSCSFDEPREDLRALKLL